MTTPASADVTPAAEAALARLNPEATQPYIDQLKAPNEHWHAWVARNILGVRKTGENQALFGFWLPGLEPGGAMNPHSEQLALELWHPVRNVPYSDMKKGESIEVNFKVERLQLQSYRDIYVGVVDNVDLGAPGHWGSFYWLTYTDGEGKRHIIRDIMANSVPFGLYAPSEAYDMEGLLAQRKDKRYFHEFYKSVGPNGEKRAFDIGACLEVHPETATFEGTFEGLTVRLKKIAKQINGNIAVGRDPLEGLVSGDIHWLGFDTYELTPEVPPTEIMTDESPFSPFFQPLGDAGTERQVKLTRPNISNWGYDTPIIGTAAINPSLLGTGRPEEFLEFVETLHTFPLRPIQLAIDVVLGHSDYQGGLLLQTFEAEAKAPQMKYLNSLYLKDGNMYGRDMNYKHPMVRTILLEVYRRKLELGFDAVRIDGGQDFIDSVDPVTGFRIQDDAFINSMLNTTITVDGQERLLDMVVEDGRPWPNDMNWQYNSAYIDHILHRTQPDGETAKQWSSLIFAHSCHGKYKWFASRWDRFKELFKDGQHWITGQGNHDNARYMYRLMMPPPGTTYADGTAYDDYCNDTYGTNPQEVIHTALDHGSLGALVLAFLPGHPMFFANALHHTPWLFFRNNDDHYGVKVTAEEGSRFLSWYVSDKTYSKDNRFPRLKALGFKTKRDLVMPLPGWGRTEEDETSPGFLDVLFELNEKVKSDPVICMTLYDETTGFGAFEHLDALQAEAHRLKDPASETARYKAARLQARIDADPLEADRKLIMLRQHLERVEPILAVNYEATPTTSGKRVLDKVHWLLAELKNPDSQPMMKRLMEWSASLDEYDIASWAEFPRLQAASPAGWELNAKSLKEFAQAFMADAAEACNCDHYRTRVSDEQARYNLACRNYRQANPWLSKNPVNDVRKDFMGRQIWANGAKDTGAFFSDKGDPINANTLYYGWRTSPDGSKRIFYVGNMEGNPIAQLDLSWLLPFEGNWQVVLESPGLQRSDEGGTITRNTALLSFKATQALVLEQQLN